MIRAAAVACMINDCGEIQVKIKVHEINFHFLKESDNFISNSRISPISAPSLMSAVLVTL